MFDLARLLCSDRFHAWPELIEEHLGLFAKFGRTLHPLLAESVDLLEDDIWDVARADLLSSGGIDHLAAENAIEFDDHLLEELNALLVHACFEVSDFLAELLLLLIVVVATTAEAACADDDAFGACWHFERVILHVFADATEDCMEQLLFRGEFALRLR